MIMSFIFDNHEIKTDDEGYLLDEKDWSEDLMHYMASLEGLTLT
ncbi:MAG TPA: sulfurtransferase TusE, partial [Succinivibrio sp.]|nr:sulfurtransferase TusE [Succinivibrio sp.]